jgi:hypothetical protein
MRLFGSGINFYGGPGESAHKHFIKIPGQRTQQRVSEFAKQIALQYYNMLVSKYVAEECHLSRSNCQQLISLKRTGTLNEGKMMRKLQYHYQENMNSSLPLML